MSSKKETPSDKQVKDSSARSSALFTSPWVEWVCSHTPALPWASEHQVDEHVVGHLAQLLCTATRSSTLRAPKAANLVQGVQCISGHTSSWVVPPNQPGSMNFPGKKWALPPLPSYVSGQYTYNMAAPMPPEMWLLHGLTQQHWLFNFFLLSH